MSDLVITVNHLDQMKICHKGARRFAKLINRDWDEFLRKGIPVSELQDIDDINVKKVIKFVVASHG